MKAKLNYTSIGPRLAVAKPLTPHVSSEYLMKLPPHQRLTCVYKRLYKLRFLMGDLQSYQNDYCNLLRRRFNHHDFNLRRNMMLGMNEQLSEESFANRLANTYAFVFNATCEPDAPIPKVNFYEDLKEALETRPETNVLQTMIRMERETPSIIKYDRKYSWVDGVIKFYELTKSNTGDLAPTSSVVFPSSRIKNLYNIMVWLPFGSKTSTKFENKSPQIEQRSDTPLGLAHNGESDIAHTLNQISAEGQAKVKEMSDESLKTTNAAVSDFVSKREGNMFIIDGEKYSKDSIICTNDGQGNKTCLKLKYNSVELFKQMQKLEYFCSLPNDINATYFECRKIT
ncbi:hypothetical protein JCM33374_g1531 [Metschnikowia sp. JCM 33374]|nr:hypothetical protein JCM33374_g1531 [Metschnikowia sp. JCM 33374]